MDLSDKIARCLAPIATSQDLRYSPTIDHLRELRREDDQTVSYGIWAFSFKTANWPLLEEEAIAVLSEQSKDLQILGWLMESWVALYGMEGLLQGLSLWTSFSQLFWDTLHPTDPEARIACLEWMDRALANLMLTLPLVEDSLKKITLMDWRHCVYLKQVGDRDSQAFSQLYQRYRMDMVQFRSIINQNLPEHMAQWQKWIAEGKDSAQHLIEVWEAKVGPISLPEMSRIWDEWQEIIEAYEPETPPPVIEEAPFTQEVIRTKADLYNAMHELCTYWEKIEPEDALKIRLVRTILQG